jgi:hypothetical protein
VVEERAGGVDPAAAQKKKKRNNRKKAKNKSQEEKEHSFDSDGMDMNEVSEKVLLGRVRGGVLCSCASRQRLAFDVGFLVYGDGGMQGESTVQHGHSQAGADAMAGEGVDPEALAEMTRTVQVEMAQQVHCCDRPAECWLKIEKTVRKLSLTVHRVGS